MPPTEPTPISTPRPAGYLCLTLHAHLPYVVNHGTWPHGLEWLLEAATETYLPLLRVLGNLQRDAVPFRCNLSLSPILLEQLSHPVFLAELPTYLQRKIDAAREDEWYFNVSSEPHYAEVARFWQTFYRQALEDYLALDSNITAGFKKFSDAGLLELLTSAATHGYLPLLGTDESISAQLRTAVATHIKHLGHPPRGIWVPECGYRPAGLWNFPVIPAGYTEPWNPFNRIGIEQAIAEAGLDYFFADSHMLPHSDSARAHYQPYYVDGAYTSTTLPPVTVFPRDPHTGLQVWSSDIGYPGEPAYLDFHKKRWPGGHRYWQVTGPHVDIADKQPYSPQQAADRALVHAEHFVDLAHEALASCLSPDNPPILTAPFDAELFGHWWYEGPLWIENLARVLHRRATTDAAPIALTTSSEYLAHQPRAGSITLREGSWGINGDHHVWINPETSWTWAHIYPAQAAVRDIATDGRWRKKTNSLDPAPDGVNHAQSLPLRIAKQLCRELLLMESSDWQILITTGAARDYAEQRFSTHNNQFADLLEIWNAYINAPENTSAQAALTETQLTRLADIEQRDSIFLEIDPALWSRRM